MEWKGGPCAIICSAPPQASLSRCSGIQAGKKARWQPDLVPPLGAKVGATKLVCRGAPVAPGSSPSYPPRRSRPSSPFPRPPHPPRLGANPCSHPAPAPQVRASGRAPRAPGPNPVPFCPDSGASRVVIPPPLLLARCSPPPLPSPGSSRRCWPPGAWGTIFRKFPAANANEGHSLLLKSHVQVQICPSWQQEASP